MSEVKKLPNKQAVVTPPADDVLLEVRNLKKHFVVGTSFFGKPIKW